MVIVEWCSGDVSEDAGYGDMGYKSSLCLLVVGCVLVGSAGGLVLLTLVNLAARLQGLL